MTRLQHCSQMARAITYPRAGFPLHLQLPPVSSWVFILFPIAASPFCLFSPTAAVDLTPAGFGGAAFGGEADPVGSAGCSAAPASDVSVTADFYQLQSTTHKGNFSRVLLGSSLFPVTAITLLLFGLRLS